MIAVFPSLYEDELVYSVLARYAVRSGYLIYRAIAEDVLCNKTERPSIEFLNRMTDDALSKFAIPLPELIHRHTMFDYYARFLDYKKRQAIYNALVNGDMKTFGNSISLRHDGKEHFLRYCPICAAEDRQQYGETYWHRIHQMPEIPICPVHHVTLCKSSVTTSSKGTPSYISAEEVVPTRQQTTMCPDDAVIRIAHYCRSVFESGYDENNTTPFSDFLNARMEYTEYRSPRGEVKKLAKLYADFHSYYSTGVLNGFTEQWQITKLLTGDRHNFYEVCLLAYFLGISADELNEMALPELSQKERFDMQVQEWHAQGIKTPEISRRLGGASVNVIKPVATGAYFHKYDNIEHIPRKAKPKSIDWEQLDKETLPKLKQYITAALSSDERPVRFSLAGTAKAIGLKPHQIKNLPTCLKYLQNHIEEQEQYWARCMVWAYRTASLTEPTITVSLFLRLLNCKKADLISALPYILHYTDESTAAGINRIIIGNHRP